MRPPLLRQLHRLGGCDDDVLLALWVERRDEEAFAALVRRHWASVTRVGRGILRDVEAAEDAAQATFLVLARRAATVRPAASLPVWLHGVARRVAMKARASARRDVPVAGVEGPAVSRGNPLDELSRRELLALLDEEVARLPRAYRLPVVLCCLEGRSQEEAAGLLGWSAGAVRGRLARGRARLQERLGRRGVGLHSALAGVAAWRGLAGGPSLTAAEAVLRIIGSGPGVGGTSAALAVTVLGEAVMTRVKLTVGVVLAAGLLGAGVLALPVLLADAEKKANGGAIASALPTPQGGAARAGTKPRQPARPDEAAALVSFRELSPEERLKQVEKLADGAKAFAPVARGDLNVTVAGRGSLEAAKGSDVFCAVRPHTKGAATSTVIKWIIDDGALVKKGDKIVELDSSGLLDQLQSKSKDVENAAASLKSAEGAFKIQRLQTKLDRRTAEVALNQAKRLLEKYAGGDEDEKANLRERVELQELNLELVKLRSEATEDRALARVKSRAATLELERERRKEIEAEISKCTLRAPQDGLAVHALPEHARAGGLARQQVVAEGEPVREGQKLMRVCTLDRFVVNLLIPEAQISRVRLRQEANLGVDAFPNQSLRGRVTAVDTVASPQHWLARGEKVYRVVVLLDDNVAGLKPGMTGGARIEVGRRPKVLQVPVEAVVRIRGEAFCFVKVGKELQERKVVTGEHDDRSVEAKKGLKEGEQVLRSPGAAAARGQTKR